MQAMHNLNKYGAPEKKNERVIRFKISNYVPFDLIFRLLILSCIPYFFLEKTCLVSRRCTKSKVALLCRIEAHAQTFFTYVG